MLRAGVGPRLFEAETHKMGNKGLRAAFEWVRIVGASPPRLGSCHRLRQQAETGIRNDGKSKPQIVGLEGVGDGRAADEVLPLTDRIGAVV